MILKVIVIASRLAKQSRGRKSTYCPSSAAPQMGLAMTSLLVDADGIREMYMQPVTDAARYDRRTIWLHWLTAGLVVAQWLGAQTIDWFPSGPWRVDARSLHITGGLVLLTIFALRVVWRATDGRRLAAADRGALHVVAKATHWGLYALVALTIALGIMNVWVRGDSIYNLFTIPSIAPGDKALRGMIEDWHGTAATLILALAGLHAGAALVHRYVWKDGVLGRMLIARSSSGSGGG